MAATAAVHPIDGPSSVERVCQDIRHAIRSGQLLPGQELSVRRVAERRQVRPRTLAQLVVGLERDGLLVVRGDAIRVSPLDAGELASVFALRRTVEMHLLERACAELDEPELARLDATVPHRVPPSPGGGFWRSMREFHLRFFYPAATAVELRLLDNVHQTTRRYHSLCIRAESRANGVVCTPIVRRGLGNHLARYHDLVDQVRARDVPAARRLVLAIGADSQVLARRAFSARLEAAPWPAADEIGA
jgi:DNA-binding GntR family transcriptional regulator